MWTVIFALVALVLLVVMIMARQRLERNGEWHAISGDRMRRYINGRWEYRAITEAEWWDDFDLKSW